jgi:hypothetical protein
MVSTFAESSPANHQQDVTLSWPSNNFLTQSRKGAKVNVFLCVLAPLREDLVK